MKGKGGLMLFVMLILASAFTAFLSYQGIGENKTRQYLEY